MEDFKMPPIETKEAKIRRMLGIIDFPKRSREEKLVIAGSEQRLHAIENITTNTLPRGPKGETKKGAVLEILEKKLIADETLKNHPLVYIGSGTDIEYPLAIGGRHIVMVDPIFSSEQAAAEILGKIKILVNKDILPDDGGRIEFTFDFGTGEENVVVQLEAKPYESNGSAYHIPDQIGALVLYASQGPGGSVRVNDEMKSKLVEGGVILEETTITRKENNHEEAFELGGK